MKHLLKAAVSEDSQAMQLAVETAGAAHDQQLTVQLIDFLMGEHDGVPKVCFYPSVATSSFPTLSINKWSSSSDRISSICFDCT